MHKVMVVDDKEDVLRIVREKLQGAGYEVIEGRDACRMIKQNPETRHIKVAVLTARTSPRDRELSAEYLADAHIDKPISMELLVKTVGRLLEG